MMYIAIDESGSMTKNYVSHNKNRWFCIALLVIKNPSKLKRAFKRWVATNLTRLKDLDKDNKMFDEKGKFKELKSSALQPQDKIKLLEYLCQNEYFEVNYILIDNLGVQNGLYDSTARAFNFILGLALLYHLNRNRLPNDDFHFYIDERNTKVKAINSLEDYLNIKFVLEHNNLKSIKVEYQESHRNYFIQIADFFSNFYYSKLYNKKYNKIFYKFVNLGYLNDSFKFPISINNTN